MHAASGIDGKPAAQRDGFVSDHIAPHLTIALMIGGIRQALIGALMSEERPDPGKLTDEIWAFMAGALRLTAGARIETLSMNRHGDLSMRAAMRDSQQVVEFRSKLIDSGLFSNVAVEEQAPTPDRQKILVRIIGQWKPSSEPRNLAGGVGRREVEKKPPEQEPGSAPIQNLRMVDRGIVSTSAPTADANK